jgi:hypothetical protein
MPKKKDNYQNYELQSFMERIPWSIKSIPAGLGARKLEDPSCCWATDDWGRIILIADVRAMSLLSVKGARQPLCSGRAEYCASDGDASDSLTLA